MRGFRKRKGPPVFGPGHARKWRVLVTAARYQARAPLAPTHALTEAAVAAEKAVMPADQRGSDSLFWRLQKAARFFHRLDDDQKHVEAGNLALLADDVEALLRGTPTKAPPAPAPAEQAARRPPRKDIFD